MFTRLFMRHVLHGTDSFGVVETARYLASLGNKAVSVAGHECGWVLSERVDADRVKRGVDFWKFVLDQSYGPDALSGFGSWALATSIDRDTWESLMLRTCKDTGGLVDMPEDVIQRAAADGSPTSTGMQIIKLVRLANGSASGDPSWQRTIDLLDPRTTDPRHTGG